MVAPPGALGMLRDVYSSAVRAELERISVKLPVLEIEFPLPPGDQTATEFCSLM
jgi:hypothetical protein